MSITFVGYMRQVDPPPADIEYLREHGMPRREVLEKIRDFPSSMPSSLKHIGTWLVSGGQVPSVIVVEAESFEALEFINTYYLGYVEFDWHPTRTGGINRDV